MSGNGISAAIPRGPSGDGASYCPIDVAHLAVDRPPHLDLFHRAGENFVLYCEAASNFSSTARSDLVGNGVTQLFARLGGGGEAPAAEIERLLDQPDSAVPAAVKAGLLYQAALDSAALVFSTPLDPTNLSRATRTAGLVVSGLTQNRNCFEALLGFLNHSPSSYAHSVNVCAYAAVVGSAIGLRSAELDSLALAAFLHDLGKARVPKSILDKAGGLTPSEWRIIRRHPSWSSDLLVNSGLAAPVLNGITQHHERLDGSGYPHGLKNTEISSLARLVALVDVYDALTSNRSYRAGLKPFDALRIIREDAGPRLDQDMFVSLVRALGRERGVRIEPRHERVAVPA